MTNKQFKFKRYVVMSSVLFLMFGTGYGQEKTYKTLTTNGGDFKPGFTVSPSLNYSRVGKADLLSFNMAAGIVLQDKWTIGGFYNTSVNNFTPEKLTIPDTYADIRYGGLHLEYTAHANKVLHLSFPLQIGYGEIELDRENGSSNFGEEGFFVVVPGIMGEVNIHPNIRFQAGLNYRLTSSFDYQNLTNSDINGLGIQAGIRAGIFNRK